MITPAVIIFLVCWFGFLGSAIGWIATRSDRGSNPRRKP